jgi:hypothetical protein
MTKETVSIMRSLSKELERCHGDRMLEFLKIALACQIAGLWYPHSSGSVTATEPGPSCTLRHARSVNDEPQLAREDASPWWLAEAFSWEGLGSPDAAVLEYGNLPNGLNAVALLAALRVESHSLAVKRK